jgi:NADPH:quinone reductase-like Zn-dependent oxidoreductase
VFPDGADVVIHLAGDANVVAAARDGGTFVSTVRPRTGAEQHVTVAPVMAHPDPQLLTRIADAHVAGRTRTVIQQIYRLDQERAFAAFAGGTVGKIVLVIDQD